MSQPTTTPQEIPEWLREIFTRPGAPDPYAPPPITLPVTLPAVEPEKEPA